MLLPKNSLSFLPFRTPLELLTRRPQRTSNRHPRHGRPTWTHPWRRPTVTERYAMRFHCINEVFPRGRDPTSSNRISYTGEPTHAVFDKVICGGGPWRRVRAVAKAGIFAPLRRWQVTENKMKCPSFIIITCDPDPINARLPYSGLDEFSACFLSKNPSFCLLKPSELKSG